MTKPQVLAKPALPDCLRERQVRSADHAHVDDPWRVLTHTSNLTFLEHAQQLRLSPGRQLGDLVEKQRAAVGVLEKTRPRPGPRL